MISKVPIAPLKLHLAGEFWDSQLYKGKLYLFTMDGRVHTVEWDKLIEESPVGEDLALPMQCAFRRSNYLYGNQWDLLYRDAQVRDVIQNKFKRLAEHQTDPLIAEWHRFVKTTHDSPFPFPHADTTIYKDGMFAVSKSGLFILPCRELHLKRNRKRQGDKMWDCPVVSVDASYGALALAAGQAGLFEYDLSVWNSSNPQEGTQVAQQHCSDCGWVYFNIIGSSHEGGGVLLEFIDDRVVGTAWVEELPRDIVGGSSNETRHLERRVEKVIQPSEIFHKQGYCWGSKDKICLAHDGLMSVARYSPWEQGPQRLEFLREVSFDQWKGNPVSGAVAAFGSIIELDKCIVVVRSDDEVTTIPGEPVNWRIFNRSRHYENQLHIIYDDRLEILSFNHDYFIDQKQKFSGFRVGSPTSWRWGR